MELTHTPHSAVNRGAITLFEAVIYFVLALAVLAIAITQGGSLFNRNDASTEYSNAAELMTNTRTMLKTSGIYNFAAADAMTGALIQFGGAPANMTVVGTKSSGSAKLQNLWGGGGHRTTRFDGRRAEVDLLTDLRGSSTGSLHYPGDQAECGAEYCDHHGQRHVYQRGDRRQRHWGTVHCR